jgi:hypothetical protein
MNKFEFASQLLYRRTQEFKQRYKDKVPYFIIYVVPFKSKEELRRRQNDVITDDKYPLDDYKKSRKVDIYDSERKKGEAIVVGKKHIKTSKFVEMEIPTVHGVFKDKKKISTEHTYEVATWNTYDCLTEDFFGEMHELDEIPDSNVVSVSLEENEIKNIKVVNFYKKHKRRMIEVEALGFQRDKSSDQTTLLELAVELTEKKSLENPLVIVDVDEKDIVIDEKTFESCFITKDESERLIAEAIEESESKVRREVIQSFRYKGIEIIISKENEVYFQDGKSTVNSVLERLKKRYDLGLEKEDDYDEQSGDDYGNSDDD